MNGFPCPPINPCPTTQVPGSPGQSAFATLISDFTLPAAPGVTPINLFVSSTAWMMPGEPILVGDQADGVATLQVLSVVSPTQASVKWLGANGDALGLTVMHVSNGAFAVPAGQPGSAGQDGINAFTLLTANLIVPNDTATIVPAIVANSQWVTPGQTVVVGNSIDGVGTFRVTTVPDTTHINMTFLNAVGDVNFGSTLSVTNQSSVSPAGAPAFPGQRFMLTNTGTTFQNLGVGQTNLMQDLLPMGQLKNAGDCIDIEATFVLLQNAHVKTVTIAFGATTLLTVTGAQNTAGAINLIIQARVIRLTGNTQLAYAWGLITGGGAIQAAVTSITTAPAEVLANAITINCTGQSDTATGDVVQRSLRNRYQPV
jgi:hypothetical protein